MPFKKSSSEAKHKEVTSMRKQFNGMSVGPRIASPLNNKEAENEGFDCGKCGARCPPTGGKYFNISPHLYCFYVDVDTTKNMFKLYAESGNNTAEIAKARLESSVDQMMDQFLTSIHLCGVYTTCNYCIRCFQKYAPEIAKNEANNVCRYYNLGCQSAVFEVE